MTQTLSPAWLLVALLAPLAGASCAGLLGSLFGGHMIRRRTSKFLTTLSVGISFAISLYLLKTTLAGGKAVHLVYRWMTVGDFAFDISFMADNLTAVMMSVVTFISLIVHIYSTGYMENDDNVSRFFCYISLFTFSMLALVMGGSFIVLFFGWEAVGVMSYLLIGFWVEKETAAKAGMKAFLVNRIADVGFVLAVGLVFAFAGSLSFTDVFAAAKTLASTELPGFGCSVATAVCLLLFVAVCGKSAQFPLHVWLPDSMEGPTPVSALIHSATMVTAGIFMVARLSPLFELAPSVLTLMTVVGAVTALLLGAVAMVQMDIKRVIAYSTISQLGYMTAALGASAYSVSVFHLTTHAFFKSLLFLAAGSVILAMAHDQDMQNMGGLGRYMPVTKITTFIGSLALAGAPFFSGFYSKEAIIGALMADSPMVSKIAAVALLIGVFVTGFYAFRLFFYVFYGEERYSRQFFINLKTEEKEKLPVGAFMGLLPGEKPHEPPFVVRAPLICLAAFSAVVGFVCAGPYLTGSLFAGELVSSARDGATAVVSHYTGPVMMAVTGLVSPAFWLALAGGALAWYLSVKNRLAAIQLRIRLRPFYRFLSNALYLDVIYEAVFVKPLLAVSWFLSEIIDKRFIDGFIVETVFAGSARAVGRALSRFADRWLIDGVFVNGGYKIVEWAASVMCHFQSGYLYHYVFVMIVAAASLLMWFVPVLPL